MLRLWNSFLIIFTSLCSWITSDLFTEFLCTSPTCTTAFSSGTLVSEIAMSSGSILEKGSNVDIVGISAISDRPSLKIFVHGEYAFIDPSFVKQTSQPDIKQLKRFKLAFSNAPLIPATQMRSSPPPSDSPSIRHEPSGKIPDPDLSNSSDSPLLSTKSTSTPLFDPHVISRTEDIPDRGTNFTPVSSTDSVYPQPLTDSMFLPNISHSPDSVVYVASTSGSENFRSSDAFPDSSDVDTFTSDPEPDFSTVTRFHFADDDDGDVYGGPNETTESPSSPSSIRKLESVHFVGQSTETELPDDIRFAESDDVPHDPLHSLEILNISAMDNSISKFESNIEDFGFSDFEGSSNFSGDIEEEFYAPYEGASSAVLAAGSSAIESRNISAELQPDSTVPLTFSNLSVGKPKVPALSHAGEPSKSAHGPHTLQESSIYPSETHYADRNESTVTPSTFSDSRSPPFVHPAGPSTPLHVEGEVDSDTVPTDDLASSTAPIELKVEAEIPHAEVSQLFHLTNDYPNRPGLVQCFAWAANRTAVADGLAPRFYSPLSYLVIWCIAYMFKLSGSFLTLLPEDTRIYLDDVLMRAFSFSLEFMVVWVLFIVHIIFGVCSCQVFWIAVKKRLGFPAAKSVTLSEFLEVEERAIQLTSRLHDQEEVNHELAKSNSHLILELKNLQDEKLSEISELRSQLDLLQAELENSRRQLTEALERSEELRSTYSSKLSTSAKTATSLLEDVDRLTKENAALNESFKTKVAELEASHQRSMDDAKAEHEELYLQAVEYYNRLKSVQPEMNKLLEARKQAEDKLAATKTELDGLRKTFVTLKSFEVALEQAHCNDVSQPAVSAETSDYAFVDDMRNTVQSDISDSSDFGVSVDHDINGCSEEPQSREAELRASLALFLNVGHLQAELELARCQAKSEEAKASCERELRENLEARLEELERESSETKARYKLLEEDRNTVQTKLDILSEYFKERELELQRDLGKHVVVGSESSEALNNCRKRNRELEAEVKAFRDQVAALRRELAETERSGRRQMTELDKRSHENWLAARAADHQIKELRDENTSLRQKLLDAERAILPPALRTQQICRSQPIAPIPLPLTALPRPTLRPGLASTPLLVEKGSVSGQSTASSTSHPSVSRIEMSRLPFPPIPFPLPHMPSGTSQRPSPFISGPSPNRLLFPHGFPPPPPPPPPPSAFTSPIRNNISPPLSSSSSVNSSIFNNTTYPQ